MRRLLLFFFFFSVLPLSEVILAQSNATSIENPSSNNSSPTATLPLPNQSSTRNAAVELSVTKMELFDSIHGVEPEDDQSQFLVIDVTLLNAISPELVFDHNVDEEVVYHNYSLRGPYLQWNAERVLGRRSIERGNPFPEPAFLSYEGDSLSGQLIYEVPREEPQNGATLLWLDEKFDLLALDLIQSPVPAEIDASLYESKGDLHLRVHDVDIQENGVELSLSGYRTPATPSVMSENGSALNIMNLSGNKLFVDGRGKKYKDPAGTPVVFVANRLLTHRLWFPSTGSVDAKDIGLVLPIAPPDASSEEPLWIFPLQGTPSIAEYVKEGRSKQADFTAEAVASDESTAIAVASGVDPVVEAEEPVVVTPPFAPPWPDPPVVISLKAEVDESAATRLAQLAEDRHAELTPGTDHSDAVVLPVNQVVGNRFLDTQRYHVYLLQPLDDPDHLTELLVWTDKPKKLRVALWDFVDGSYGKELMRRTGHVSMSRLRIQKPTLLYLSKKKGELDYRMIWRTMQKLEPGLEHEPNSFRAIDTELTEILPHMHKQTSDEYALSGYVGGQDKIDYFVLESDEAGFVTLEATSGTLGIFSGKKGFKSKVVDKRVFLTDILVLPGKNVFYINGVKGDYSIKATLSPLTDRYHELEPNGTVLLAHRLPIGQERTGRLPVAKDYDYYFFNWPTTGPLRFSAQSGEGGDLSLWLYKDGAELLSLGAATSISEVIELEAGTYELLAFTYNPSLEPYSMSVSAENPIAADALSSALSIEIVADTNIVEPFSSKGQIINGTALIKNSGNTKIDANLIVASSHDRIIVDLPESSISIAANGEAEIPFQVKVRRSTHAFGDVPLFFSIADEGGAATTQWTMAFPYDAPPTPMVWHDQPLPAEFMGAFDVAQRSFGAVVHRDVTCRCTPKLATSKTVFGTDRYHLKSSLCAAAVHAGKIGVDGGLVRLVSAPGLDKYIGSERNGIESKNGKTSAASFQFQPVLNNDQNQAAECGKVLKLDQQGSTTLFSGLPFRSYFRGESVAVNLAGEEPVNVSGVILSLRGTGKNKVREFSIEVSNDGLEFNKVFSGKLQLNNELQPFVFDSPVPARFVRAHLISGFKDQTPAVLRLSALKVIAAKDKPILLHSGVNLADPAMGAHVFVKRKGESVLSFHHNRIALVSEVEIQSAESKQVSSVTVQVSEDGPYGPWTVVANEQIEPKSTATVVFHEPVKAKYIRLSGNWSKAGKVFASAVWEVGSNDAYQSIVAEWGNHESDAYFELGVEPAQNVASTRIDSTAELPFDVVVDQPVNSTVSLPLDLTDYFRVAVPENTLAMQLEFTGDTRQLEIEITDTNGNALDYSESKAPGSRKTTLTIKPVLELEQIFVKVNDKPKNLAVLWDDSRSVLPYVPGLQRMLRNFAFDVDPRYEKINLMPLRDKNPKFLLDTWADSPYQLLGAMRNYINTGSSAAYVSMINALGNLADADGVKALLIMTDEQGDRNRFEDNKMEKMLAETDVSVFSFHATSSESLHDINANHMQSWADIGGGRYTFIRSKNEVPDAIAKVQAWLRKPGAYQIQATAIDNTPGSLTVVSNQENSDQAPIIALGAVEVILDASGSMWKKMADGQPRIVVAKEVLLELVSEKLPEKLPFALRVFGNRKARSCRTDLELKLGPLSRENAVEKIKSIKPQDRSKTPIGASLAAVTKDLKKASGKRIVILITDGEETCDADPRAVIADLKEQGFDIQVNIVGFAIDDDTLKAEFAEWASIGGGDYFDTNDAQQLIQSLQEALVPQFSVRNALGDVVAEGRMNGASVELLPGEYSVGLSVDGYEPKVVTVPPGGGAKVTF